MAYIDKIKKNNTTYDIQDSKAARKAVTSSTVIDSSTVGETGQLGLLYSNGTFANAYLNVGEDNFGGEQWAELEVNFDKLVGPGGFGIIWYYPTMTEDWAASSEYQCTVNSVDTIKFQAWVDSTGRTGNNISFNYSLEWMSWVTPSSDPWMPMDEPVDMATLGIDVTILEASAWSSFQMSKTTTVSGTPVQANISKTSDFESLCFTAQGQTCTINDVTISNYQIYEYQFPENYRDPMQYDVSVFGTTYFPDNFLAYCANFEHFMFSEMTTSTISNTVWVNKIGDNFMRNCPKLVGARGSNDNTINFEPSPVTEESLTIGDYFMSYSTLVSTNVSVSSFASIGDYFMNNCYTAPIPRLYSGNSVIKKATIGNNFCMGRNVAQDTYLSFPYWDVTCELEIGNNFLSGVRAEIPTGSQFSTLTKVGQSFFYGQNSTASMTRNVSFPALKTIGNAFMQGFTKFNGTISLPVVETIGRNFLSGCTSFNSELSLPASIKSIGAGFMYNCTSFTNTVDFGTLPASAITADNSSFGTNSSSAAMYVTGVTIKGVMVQDIINKFPNRTSNPYRKLINGGNGVITIDSTLSTSSTNPVENQAITNALNSMFLNGGTTAPTTSTVGNVGTLYSYVDTTGATPVPKLMVCTEVDSVTPSYTWVEAGGGGQIDYYTNAELEELWEGES